MIRHIKRVGAYLAGLFVICGALVGCKSAPVKPETVFIKGAPEVQVVYRDRYVQLPKDVLERCQWTPNVKPSKAMSAAVERAGALKCYESKQDTARDLSGKAVK